LLRFATSKREKNKKIKKIKGRKIQLQMQQRIVSVQPENSANSLIAIPKADCPFHQTGKMIHAIVPLFIQHVAEMREERQQPGVKFRTSKIAAR